MIDYTGDPFAKPYEACGKCGQPIRPIRENIPGGYQIAIVCSKCSHKVVTNIFKSIRESQGYKNS